VSQIDLMSQALGTLVTEPRRGTMSESLSENERKQIAEVILSGGRVSPKYAASIIETSRDIELIWSGKSDDLEHVVLPFQSIEQIDEPRLDAAEEQSLFYLDFGSGRQSGGWTNKLIWGDNGLILSSLARGPLKHSIDEVGGLKFIYIDPPYDVGYDFAMDVSVGDVSVTKEPSVIEQFAFRDTWGQGIDSYLSMMNTRLRQMEALLADNGVIAVHCDWRVMHHIRHLMDEIFGSSNFINEIIWRYGKMSNTSRRFPQNHDVIITYSKGENYTFNPIRDADSEYKNRFIRYVVDNKVRFGSVKSSDDKLILLRRRKVEKDLGRELQDEDILFDFDEEFKTQDDVFYDISIVKGNAEERTNYPTQKPESLLERLLLAFTNEGDLVADFFCGSGTTMAVAEKLGRKWLGCDLGRFAIHTSRKRLISVQRALKDSGKPYRSFEILNLGGYERQHYLSNVTAETDAEGLKTLKRKAFVELVLTAYSAQPSNQLPPFSGSKHLTAVFIGEVNRAVTQSDVEECIEAAISSGITKVDILGFEFEMGISPLLADKAKEQGLTLTLRYIPSDVFDSRAVTSGAVQFYEVGYLEVKPDIDGRELRINLTDFGVFYRQTDADEAAISLRPGGSKIVVDQGQVLRLSKSKSGTITSENVTSRWEDWIDYWSIDFNFESKPEIIRVLQDGNEIELATGRFIFENEWQSFRTIKDRNLELWSAPHTYEKPGIYSVAVKVIDIFGNDTTRVFKVKVGK